MGSKQRFAYSALGDSVNLASRLEGQTKTYGVDILVGEDTYKKTSDMAFIELDIIQVIGREKPVRIYTLLGDKELANEKMFQQWQAAHNGMLAAYRAADFGCAAQDCKEAAKLADGKLKDYYDLYKKRIVKYTKTPPPDNWGGVFIAKNK
jgi:adenylate cyclase